MNAIHDFYEKQSSCSFSFGPELARPLLSGMACQPSPHRNGCRSRRTGLRWPSAPIRCVLVTCRWWTRRRSSWRTHSAISRRKAWSVRLTRELGWGSIRDKITYGELDAAHATGGLLFSILCGTHAQPRAVATDLLLNLQGNAITPRGGCGSAACGRRVVAPDDSQRGPAQARLRGSVALFQPSYPAAAVAACGGDQSRQRCTHCHPAPTIGG